MEIKSNLLEIEALDVKQLPELQGMREKQIQIVKENPYVEITDNKSYDEAKKARTTLVTARTEIQNQDKLIASKIKKFREAVAGVSEELISITRPHEEKQQQEVKRWEELKEKEKQEKLRQEEERKNNIRNSISCIIDEAYMKINKCSFETIESLKVDFEEGLYKTDVSQFEEFELDFNEKLIQFKNAFSSKIKTLEEAEAQRLEKIRLENEAAKLNEERIKLEAKAKEEAERLKKIKEEQELAIKAERAAMEAEKAAHALIIKQKEEEAQKEREAAEAKLKQDRDELEAEKARLAKIEADKIAQEEVQRKAKEEEERKAKEKAEADAKAKLETERLEALKPEKQKAVEYIQSLNFSNVEPKITDELLNVEFKKCLQKISDTINESVSAIQNFK
ncbi:hypothetical protein EGI16_10785 [Chryseobacterium sp. G0240]|uniref:hypothetical protein n=1 Tax=Chryseobacterium sp. G0240 TaxID=2487066 RepID=UPI000F44C9D4|nr:hypothetical protein [Chryseobacterium sp. G0240]ROI03690.1 hypothetical protein EGI16_10785 [Chryseobacterium sp. G0240]